MILSQICYTNKINLVPVVLLREVSERRDWIVVGGRDLDVVRGLAEARAAEAHGPGGELCQPLLEAVPHPAHQVLEEGVLEEGIPLG